MSQQLFNISTALAAPDNTRVENFTNSLDQVYNAVCKIHSDSNQLQMLRSQCLIHWLQYKDDMEDIKFFQKKLRNLFEKVGSLSVPSQLNQNFSNLQQCQPNIKINSNNSFFNQNIHLKKAFQISNPILSCSFNSNGSIFAFVTKDTAYIMNSNDFELITTANIKISINPSIDNIIVSLSFSKNNQYLAISGCESEIILISPQNGQFLGTLKNNNSISTTLSFSNDSSKLFSGYNDGSIILWDIKTFEIIYKRQIGQNEIINGLSITQDEKFISCSFLSGSIVLFEPNYNPKEEQQVMSFNAQSSGITSLSMSNDGTLLASGSPDNTVKIWSVKGIASCINTLRHSNSVLSIDFSFDKLILLSTSKDTSIKGWNIKSGELLFSIFVHQNSILKIIHHPNQKSFITVSLDGLFCYWNYQLP